MRFKLSAEKAILTIAVTYVLMLAVNSELNRYIHPRYISFTIIMCMLGLLVLLLHRKNAKHNHQQHSGPIWAVATILIFAIAFPARTLTSATVSQRATDAGSIVTTTESQSITTLLAGSTKSIGLSDWSRLLQTNTDPDFYANKPANASGFIYDAGLGPDTVWVARFVLTCCAVDAQPVGVPVHIPNWQDTYSQDQWIEVSGDFAQTELEAGIQMVLQPTGVNMIDEPEDPYAN